MNNPIPAYLMALAVGDLIFKPIDHRTGVYAEPEILDSAAWGFTDLGKMVTTEQLYGPLCLEGDTTSLCCRPVSIWGYGKQNDISDAHRNRRRPIRHHLLAWAGPLWSGNLVTTQEDFWLWMKGLPRTSKTGSWNHCMASLMRTCSACWVMSLLKVCRKWVK